MTAFQNLLMMISATELYAILVPIFIILVLWFWLMPLYGKWQTAKALGVEGWKGIIPCYNWYVFQTACDPTKRNLALACGIVSLLAALTTTRYPDGTTSSSAFGFVAFILQLIVLWNLCDHFGKSRWYALGIILVPFVFWWKLGVDAYIKE